MALPNISKTENFFVEGSGTAYVLGDNDKLNLIHLQNMTLELTSTMENIFGGESNFSLYSYNTEKGAKITFTNASWNLDIMNLSQGTSSDASVEIFKEEKLTVGNDGKVTLSETPVDGTLMVFDSNNTIVTVDSIGTDSGNTYAQFDSSLTTAKLNVCYRYTLPAGKGIGTSLYTIDVPGFVSIYHKSKPMKQKNGRIIRLYTTIYRARCDGAMTINFEHKNAFAPELAFDVVDPERADGKYMSFAVRDTTVEDANNRNTVQGT